MQTDLLLDQKVNYNVALLPNFFNKSEITNMLGNFYDASQIDGVIDQKYIFSNPGGNLNQRWVRLGTITYPTNQLSDAKSTISRILFRILHKILTIIC